MSSPAPFRVTELMCLWLRRRALASFILINWQEMTVVESTIDGSQLSITLFCHVDFGNTLCWRFRVINLISVQHQDQVSISLNFPRVFHIGVHWPLIGSGFDTARQLAQRKDGGFIGFGKVFKPLGYFANGQIVPRRTLNFDKRQIVDDRQRDFRVRYLVAHGGFLYLVDSQSRGVGDPDIADYADLARTLMMAVDTIIEAEQETAG